MKAITVSEFGATPALTNVPTPNPEPHEVRVRIHAASVNNIDRAVIAGAVQAMMEHRFPLIPGQDFAGVIDEVGTEVSDYEVGDRVYGVALRSYFGAGSYAEYVTVPTVQGIAKLPDAVSFTQAAALGVAGATALQAISLAKITADDTVLVVGATGGVGNAAVQLAKLAGARVLATAATTEDRQLMRNLGADAVVDYTNESNAAATLAAVAPMGVDVVFHFAGDRAAAATYAAPGARFVSASAPGSSADRADLMVHQVRADISTAKLTQLAQLVSGDELIVNVTKAFKLEDAALALASFSAGKTGKIVIEILE